MLYNVVDGDTTQKVLKIGPTLINLKPQQFVCPAGLTITLDSGFRQDTIPPQTFCVYQDWGWFVALKETFGILQAVGIDENSTLADYAQVVFRNNQLTNTVLQYDTANNLHYFAYEKWVSGQIMHYYAVIIKGSDAFWLCQFACAKDKFSDCLPYFIDCAKTITVS